MRDSNMRQDGMACKIAVREIASAKTKKFRHHFVQLDYKFFYSLNAFIANAYCKPKEFSLLYSQLQKVTIYKK